MYQYYVIVFSELDFKMKNHMKMYEMYGQAKDALTFAENRLVLVYSLLNSKVTEETYKRFGTYFGFYFVIDKIIDRIKNENGSDLHFNIIGVINHSEIPREASCKYLYCS